MCLRALALRRIKEASMTPDHSSCEAFVALKSDLSFVSINDRGQRPPG